MKKKNNEEWIAAGRHLPKFMRDFHDQKDLFKTIEKTMGKQEEPYGVNWVAGQCYVVDKFLMFMAKHGYVLSRVHNRDHCDVDQTISDVRRAESDSLNQILLSAMVKS